MSDLERMRIEERDARRREQNVRETAGLCGLTSLIGGTAMLSVPWALIVLGTALLGMSLWGAIRSDRSAARNPQ